MRRRLLGPPLLELELARHTLLTTIQSYCLYSLLHPLLGRIFQEAGRYFLRVCLTQISVLEAEERRQMRILRRGPDLKRFLVQLGESRQSFIGKEMQCRAVSEGPGELPQQS